MLAAALPFMTDAPALLAWFWLTALIAVVWLRRHRDLNQARHEPVLTDSEAVGDHFPMLSVLVAAKDEQANIERCLRGLLAQDYPHLQLIAINDRSADRTGSIIDQLAARDDRLSAVHVAELPAGWFGKNNAMRLGMTDAVGEWVCFTDADCAYDSPKLLRAAVSFALRERVEFLSVLPRLEAETFWERVIQPVAGAVMVFWFPPNKVNDPQSSAAYANGAFMLMSRSAYTALGGHERAKATLNEDIHMAREAKRVGARLHVIRGGTLYRVRMYVGLQQIWRGWTRIFYGCFGTFPRLLASALMLAIFSLSPYLTLLASPFASHGAPWLAAAALAAILAQQSVLWRFYGLSHTPRPWALTYPLGAFVCLGLIINAMSRLTGRKTTWRGTTYTGGAKTRG